MREIVYSVREIVSDFKIIYGSQIIKFFFFISISLRLFFLEIFQPSQPSSLAPDEGTYAHLANYVSQNLVVRNFPVYGPTLYYQSKSLIVPSSLLIRLGFDPLESVRIVSAIYGLFIPILVFLCFSAVQNSRANIEKIKLELKYIICISLIVILFFLPSNFLWSTLGLRESASQFWILAQTYFLIKFYKGIKGTRIIFAFLTVASSVFSFTSRPQTALLISINLIILGFLVALKRRTLSFLLVSISCFILGSFFSSTPEVKLIRHWTAIETKENVGQNNSKKIGDVVSDNTAVISKSCRFRNETIRIDKKTFQCLEVRNYGVTNLSRISILPQNIDFSKIEERRNVNRIGASSALAPSYCSKLANDIESIKCNLAELPYRLSAFLFRPLPFIDQGSAFLFYAGLENLVWLFLILITLSNLARLRFRSLHKEYIISVSIFLISFATAAALYEGNMGTAFRHKSTLVGHLILLNLLIIWSPNRGKLDYEHKKPEC